MVKKSKVPTKRTTVALSSEQHEWAKNAAPDGNLSAFLRYLVCDGMAHMESLPPDNAPSAKDRKTVCLVEDLKFRGRVLEHCAHYDIQRAKLFRRSVDRVRLGAAATEGRLF